jgi:pyrroloquinoline-quinone synthase
MNPSPSLTMQSFSSLTQNHPLWNHEFLVRCRTGQLTLPEVQVLAVQMYKFSKEFNRILASILSRCPDENAQLVIMDNLFDEMGQGDLNQAHPELFRRFTREIGIADDALAIAPTAPETLNMIATYLDIPHQYGYLAALGAVCFASEGIVSSLYSQLYRGIVGAAPFPKESLIFFEVHIHVDDSHAANLARLIEPRVTTQEQAAEVNRAILQAMDARVQFFDGIQRQVANLERSNDSLLLLTA